LCEKAASKILVELTPEVDFIYMLRAAFTYAGPKSIKIQSSCQYLFALLESVRVKAARKKLMKLTPG